MLQHIKQSSFNFIVAIHEYVAVVNVNNFNVDKSQEKKYE